MYDVLTWLYACSYSANTSSQHRRFCPCLGRHFDSGGCYMSPHTRTYHHHISFGLKIAFLDSEEEEMTLFNSQCRCWLVMKQPDVASSGTLMTITLMESSTSMTVGNIHMISIHHCCRMIDEEEEGESSGELSEMFSLLIVTHGISLQHRHM